MKSTASGRNVLLVVFVAAAILSLLPGRAEAQFGFGMGMGGFGWGFGGFSQVPKPESFLYQKALVDARTTRICLPVTSTLTIPTLTSTTFVTTGLWSGIRRARDDPAHYGYAPRPSPATTPTAMTVAPRMPVLPLSSFYNRQSQFVWPGDAPTAGELKEKRAIFDRASDAVVAETKKNGVASMATVTDARQKLLDYGRPGLAIRPRPRNPPRRRHLSHVPAVALRIAGPGGQSADSGRCSHSTRARHPEARGTLELSWGKALRALAGGDDAARFVQGLTARATTASRFFRDRSRWTTLPSRPIRTLDGISVTP